MPRFPRIRTGLKYTALSAGVFVPVFYALANVEKQYASKFSGRDSPLGNLFFCITASRRVVDTAQLVSFCGSQIIFWNFLWNKGQEIESIRKLIGWHEDWEEYMHPVHMRVANHMLTFCIRNGGLVVKVGQALSSVPSLPLAYGDILKVLFDRNPHMDFHFIKEVIENDFGCKIDDIFSDFEREPIGSASLAQVHTAKLKMEDQSVAVKVEYPYISYFQNIDLYNMTTAMKTVYILLHWMDSPMKEGFNTDSPSYQDLCDRFFEETNLLKELSNAKRVKQNFRDWKYVYIPSVYDDYCSKRVLTMEYIDNACISTDIEKMESWNLSVKECTQLMVDAFAKQTFVDGFLHADPHRSNIFVRKHPTLKGKPQVVLLDHGLYTTLDPTFKHRFASYYKALALNDTKYLKKFLTLYDIDSKYYKLFASMILMDMYDDKFSAEEFDETGGKFRKRMSKMMNRKMTDEQRLKMVQAQRDLTKAFSDQLPPSFRFVLRNGFLLRSVNAANGSPCNRLITNARWASYSIHQLEDENAFFIHRWYSRSRQILSSFYFEARLQWLRLQSYLLYLGFRYFPLWMNRLMQSRVEDMMGQAPQEQLETAKKQPEVV